MLKIKTPTCKVDGAKISKDSERILNKFATVIYYILIVIAALNALAGVGCLIAGICGVLEHDYAESVLIGGGLFIAVFLHAVFLYLIAIVIRAAINCFCNISLSLKVLAFNQQPAQLQSEQQATEGTEGTAACPECGEAVVIGRKSCPNCGCPLKWEWDD